MRLPALLQVTDDAGAVAVLQRYYGVGDYLGSPSFTGARFDTWDPAATRTVSTNVFTSDDLVAVTLLSVNVDAAAAIDLLDRRAGDFTSLLKALGPDRDLTDEHEPWPDDWPGWTLWSELRQLPGVGPTTASKLLARKRPRLRPVYDSVVAAVLESKQLWEPLREKLTTDPNLHQRLIRLRKHAGLPDDVSPLRIFDVLAWMEGKGYQPRSPWQLTGTDVGHAPSRTPHPVGSRD